MILIVGATGKVGSAVVHQLRQLQQPFRALAHSERSAALLLAQGVEIVRGSVDDPRTLAHTLAGIDKLFLVTPARPDQPQIEQRVIDVAAQHAVGHIVKLSTFGINSPTTFARLHQPTEAYLKASGIPYTLLQPHMFMQNFHESDLPTILHEQTIINPAGEVPIGFVDTRDIAAMAVAALTDDRHQNQTYVVTGPEALTYTEVAASLSEQVGRPITYHYLAPTAFSRTLQHAGIDPWYAQLTTELFAYLNAHPQASSAISIDIVRVLGRPAISVKRYIAEHRHLFAA